MDLRCPGKGLRARVTDKGLVELPCDSKFCGKTEGTVVLHRWDPTTGDVVETLRFKNDPRKDK